MSAFPSAAALRAEHDREVAARGQRILAQGLERRERAGALALELLLSGGRTRGRMKWSWRGRRGLPATGAAVLPERGPREKRGGARGHARHEAPPRQRWRGGGLAACGHERTSRVSERPSNASRRRRMSSGQGWLVFVT